MKAGRSRRFRSAIEDAGRGGAFVSVPFDVERVFGKKRVPVNATIDGEPYRGSLVRMGGDRHMLPVLKGIRQRIGKGPGDSVEVTVEEDLKPRVVAIPRDLRHALDGRPKTLRFFRSLSYTRQREYVQWIEAARRKETRVGRAARAARMLGQGKRGR